VQRVPIGQLSSADLAKLAQAYAALRALPDSDPRSWRSQANLHATYCMACNNATQIHFRWSFFPWHRAYLYYHERILGQLVGNLTGFRLPYWDWEVSRTIPSAYLQPGNATNSLWDSARDCHLNAGQPLPVDDGTTIDTVYTLYELTDFATFGGTSFGGGSCELGVHGQIHVDVGTATTDLCSAPWTVVSQKDFHLPNPDMGDLGYAAQDPLFFAHHANIDKIWSIWNRQRKAGMPPGAYQNPTDPAFLDMAWTFYDENAKVVSIRVRDVLDHEGNLRYTYQPLRIKLPTIPLLVAFPCFIVPCSCPGPDPILKVSLSTLASVFKAVNQGSPVVLVLRGVRIPQMQGTFGLVATRGSQRTLLGRIAIVGSRAMSHEQGSITAAFDVTRSIKSLLATSQPATLSLIQGGTSKSFPLQANSAQLRVR